MSGGPNESQVQGGSGEDYVGITWAVISGTALAKKIGSFVKGRYTILTVSLRDKFTFALISAVPE